MSPPVMVRRFIFTPLRTLVSRSFLSSVLALFVLGFALFQKRLLPPKLASLAARFYFYPTLPLTYLRLCTLPPRAGLWTAIDDTVIVGAAPTAALNHPRRLRSLGVRGVVNCCAEYAGPDWTEYGVDALRVPTIDHVEPTPADLEKAVRFIDKHAKKGHKVYVHCKAGHGRSAAIAFAWLCHRHYGNTAPYDLFQRIASRRKIRKNLWRQPNIVAFYEALPLSTSSRSSSLLQQQAAPLAPTDDIDDDDDDFISAGEEQLPQEEDEES